MYRYTSITYTVCQSINSGLFVLFAKEGLGALSSVFTLTTVSSPDPTLSRGETVKFLGLAGTLATV